jgi:hypothetical protein
MMCKLYQQMVMEEAQIKAEPMVQIGGQTRKENRKRHVQRGINNPAEKGKSPRRENGVAFYCKMRLIGTLYEQHKALLAADGFEGFFTVVQLLEKPELLPNNVPGVYQILWRGGKQPRFLDRNPAFWHKRRDPTVAVTLLIARWDPLSPILYIGKAKRKFERIMAYLKFGNGYSAAHWGGRYIWQLADAEKLIVCWKPCIAETERSVERSLLAKYKAHYGHLPFANLRG